MYSKKKKKKDSIWVHAVPLCPQLTAMAQLVMLSSNMESTDVSADSIDFFDQQFNITLSIFFLTLAFLFSIVISSSNFYIFRKLGEKDLLENCMGIIFGQLVIEMLSKHTLFGRVLLWGNLPPVDCLQSYKNSFCFLFA